MSQICEQDLSTQFLLVFVETDPVQLARAGNLTVTDTADEQIAVPGCNRSSQQLFPS